ncbi:MAG: SDR family oxidoreductase [Actinomycetota bacterium]|nr:SDR family oxidoreductase [Actinomycetota bacterium]
MQRFEKARIVITGGTGGIGLATAERLVAEGADVLVTGRDPERLAGVGARAGITAVANDAADPDAADALRDAVEVTFGGTVDGLFLNAGLGAFQPLDAVDATELDRQYRVNVRGPLLQLRALSPLLADGASVLLNTSVLNDLGMPGSAVYAATKGAVRSAMNVLANELGARGIRVNAISPGPIDTGFMAATGLAPDEVDGFVAQVVPRVPLGRMGRPEEVAAAAAFLPSNDASYVTGSELVVSGGIS